MFGRRRILDCARSSLSQSVAEVAVGAHKAVRLPLELPSAMRNVGVVVAGLVLDSGIHGHCAGVWDPSSVVGLEGHWTSSAVWSFVCFDDSVCEAGGVGSFSMDVALC